VIHLDIPSNLEAYFQEAGRAGRDGHKAFAVAIIGVHDREQMQQRFEQSFPSLEFIRNLYRMLCMHYGIASGSLIDQGFPFDLLSFCEKFKFEIVPVLEALKVLEHSQQIVLNDSLYQPSLLQVVADKEALYRHQVKYAEEDLIIKSLLRSYEGILSAPVRISEFRIGKQLELHEEDVVYYLHQLQEAGIVQYQPRTEHPRIYFLGERQKASQMALDQKWYAFKKERSLDQMQKIWEYVETEDCRSRFMQIYFGETAVERCGICDLCIKEKKSGLIKWNQYKKQVLEILRHESPMSTWELINRFSLLEKEELLRLVGDLESENWVRIQGDSIQLLDAKNK
jgi:ATP-dependent DNA helicase RecQ